MNDHQSKAAEYEPPSMEVLGSIADLTAGVVQNNGTDTGSVSIAA